MGQMCATRLALLFAVMGDIGIVKAALQSYLKDSNDLNLADFLHAYTTYASQSSTCILHEFPELAAEVLKSVFSPAQEDPGARTISAKIDSSLRSCAKCIDVFRGAKAEVARTARNRKDDLYLKEALTGLQEWNIRRSLSLFRRFGGYLWV
ncbi:hypothetical protein BJ742DRAFT_798967 [Cladochytrium replicatum]|nr:hypothetical protein BJ742DRAFT_798967 [Cladochytrium replicatum]